MWSMPLRLEDLDSHLRGALAPIYFVSGDETLLVQEACDAIVAAAQTRGYSERSVLHVEPGFRWHNVTQDAASMSLFAERRIIDVRVAGNKFDREAHAVLREYANQPAPDTVLLIRSARLESRQRSAAWFKALDGAGAVITVWPIGVNELPRWLNARLRAAEVELDPQALAYLAQQVEGNLLAAVQEIAKLKLAELEAPISADALAEVMEDSAHYDAFELIDAIFAGDLQRVSRMLGILRQEGVALFAILGAIVAQLRRLRGAGARMPPQRQRLVEGFLRRLGSASAIDRVLSQCALIDAQGKGQLLGDAWLSLENLCLRLAGSRKLPSLEAQLAFLQRA
jgi:DNA polymerase-3 subunit delta